MSVKTKMIIAVTSLVTALMVILIILSVKYFEAGLKDQIFHQQMQLVTEMTGRIDDKLLTAQDFLAARARLITPELVGSRERMKAFFDASTGLHKLYSHHLILFSPDGKPLVESSSPHFGNDLPQPVLDALRKTRRTGHSQISEPYIAHPMQKQPAVMVTVPLLGPNRKLIAILGGGLDLTSDNYLGKLSRFKIGQTGYLSLSTADRVMIMHPDPARIMQKTEAGTNELYGRALAGFEGSGESVNLRGIPVLASYKRLKAKNWLLAANYPIAEAYAPITRIETIYVLSLAACSIAVAIALALLLRRLTSPLIRMTQHVQVLPALAGTDRHLPVTTSDEIGVLSRAFNQMIDEIDRQHASLLRSEELHRTMTEFTTDLVFWRAPDRRLLFISHTCLTLTGYGEQDFYDDPDLLDRIIYPEDRECWLHHAHGAGPSEKHEALDFRLIRKDGRVRWISHVCVTIRGKNGEALGVRGSHTDITDRKRLEEQLRHSQKMEAVGQLASGIAHDFNNILTVIAGYGGILKKHLGAEERLRTYLDEIIASTRRASGLTQSLLAFSRKQTAELRPVNLNELILGFQKVIGRIIGEDAFVNAVLAPEELIIEADPGQIEQVFLNLATNARDAMPRGGTLRIATATTEIDEKQSRTVELHKPGQYALITISDTGVGMAKAVQEHIFEPFFTTKGVGKGTGLGLSIVYGIVTRHHGAIHVYSEPGQGTEFKIYLPLVKKTAFAAAADSVPPPRGHETVLVVEDDAAVRKVARVILEEAGYTVLEGKDGDEAVEVFEKNRDLIRLVLCDVIMPGKNGIEVCAQIEKIRPGTKVIFMSGYTGDMLDRKGIPDKGCILVSKPLNANELLTKARSALAPA